MSKKAIDPCATDGNHNNNFYHSTSSPVDYTASPTYPGAGTSLTIQDGTTVNNYGYESSITLTGAGGMVPSGSSMKLARIRLMYGDATEQIAVAPVGVGVVLPTQGQQITSTASAGGKQRTVKVLRSNATLPAIFDYALFNGSTSTLSK
jgi:hypothetical protein